MPQILEIQLQLQDNKVTIRIVTRKLLPAVSGKKSQNVDVFIQQATLHHFHDDIKH